MKLPDALDPDRLLEDEFAKLESEVRIRIESRRYGKKMTVLDGFSKDIDLAALATELKKALGVGGTAKDGTVELQGDQSRAVRAVLEKRGFVVV